MEILYPFLGIMLLVLIMLGFSWMRSFRRGRPFVGSFQLLSSMTLLLLLVAGGLIIFSTLGYQNLTYEQQLAHISIKKQAQQKFSADIVLEDGQHFNFEISGDEIYIDARILKWKPWANLIGIHSLYRLDRVGGRYIEYDEEINKQRSLFQFIEGSGKDLFDYRSDYEILGWMVDAEYGNAAFIPVKDQAEYLLSLSSSGLILRDLKENP